MFNNNPYYQQGFVAPNRPQARYTQPVTNEMSKMVLTNDDELSVKISTTEKIKKMCTHKYPGTTTIALVETPSDTDKTLVTCRVCGETFHMIMDANYDSIKEIADKCVDVLQSAKTLYLDAPEEFTKEYFQIITLLKRIPNVFKKGMNNWSSYEVSNDPRSINGNMNSFQQVNGMVGGANIGGVTPMGVPMGGYYQPAPGYYPPNVVPTNGYYTQPNTQYVTNQYGQVVPVTTQVAPNENPLMTGGPVQPQPQPQQVPVQVQQQPVAPAPAPAPGVAPAAQTGEIVQTKAFSV